MGKGKREKDERNKGEKLMQLLQLGLWEFAARADGQRRCSAVSSVLSPARTDAGFIKPGFLQ